MSDRRPQRGLFDVHCQHCGAVIRFVETERGRKMPVEVDMIQVFIDGRVRKAHVPHWANCAGADDARKR